MTYIIEVCCTGNLNRSAMEKVIGNKVVQDENLDDKIRFISSGTRADPQWDNVLPYKKVVSILGKAVKSGLMKETRIDKESYENDPGYRVAIQSQVHTALKMLRPIEEALRTAALYQIGLEYNGRRSQTVARDDVSLLLGNEKKHVEHAKAIYEGKEKQPEISHLNEYAGVPGEIADCLGNLDVNVYINARKEIEHIMPKVVDRFRQEHSL